MNDTTDTQKVVRVIVKRAGKCVINSPLNPPATRQEIESMQWAKNRGGFQSFNYDKMGVVIVSTL